MPNKVYVINKHGRPLMPCSPAKARHLLDAGKAKVKKRTPFTIQLVYGSSGYTQEVILGVDAGSKTIGMSASTTKEELLSAEVKPRNDVVDLLSARREFRRARRNRKTRYRKPRFDNRVRSKHKGWLAPSVEVKIQEHITSTRDATFMGIMRKTLMQRLCSELPIPVVKTRGYITKATREKLLVLPKSHTNDALAIAQGKRGFNVGYLPEIAQIDKIYTIRPVRHHNRQLHKATILKGGIRKSNQTEKYVFGYRLFDKVQFNGQDCFIWGRRTSGYFAVKTIDGKVIHNSASFKKLNLVERASNYLIA